MVFHRSGRRSFLGSGLPKKMLFLKKDTLLYKITPVTAKISRNTACGKKLIMKYLNSQKSLFYLIYCPDFAGIEQMATFAYLKTVM